MSLYYAAEWDLALQQIVPFIDGVKYVKRISLEADVEIAIVKKCVRQLLYYGCVTMIDIFLHSNIYAITPRIALIANDPKLQVECAVYITKSGKMPPPFAKIFALYCSMQPSLRMSDFCVVYAESLASIDVRRFITFGLIHSFLRRVHRFPIHIDRSGGGVGMSSQQQQQRQFTLTSSPLPSSLSPGTTANGNNASSTMMKRNAKAASVKASQFEKDVLRLMDGEHQTDEICSALMLRFTDVETLVQKNPSCFVVHK